MPMPSTTRIAAQQQDGGAGLVGQRRQRRALLAGQHGGRDGAGDRDDEQHVERDRRDLRADDAAHERAPARVAREHDARAVADRQMAEVRGERHAEDERQRRRVAALPADERQVDVA